MYPMNYGNPYGPSMAGSEGNNGQGLGLPHGFAFRHPMLGGGLPPQSMPMRTGGGLPPMYLQAPHTGGPLPPQNTGIMPPNILAGVGYPPQMAMQVRTGGYDAPQQQMPQNRLGLGGGYNYGLGGLLR